jgi:hypothetical protein
MRKYIRLIASDKLHTSITTCPHPLLCKHCPPTAVQLALLLALQEPEPTPVSWRTAAMRIRHLLRCPRYPAGRRRARLAHLRPQPQKETHP